jgi:hypothetical protein
MTEAEAREQWTEIILRLKEPGQMIAIEQMLVDLMDVTEQTEIMDRVVKAHKAFREKL